MKGKPIGLSIEMLWPTIGGTRGTRLRMKASHCSSSLDKRRSRSLDFRRWYGSRNAYLVLSAYSTTKMIDWLPENGFVSDSKAKIQSLPSLSSDACAKIPGREMVWCNSLRLMWGMDGAQMMRFFCSVTLFDDECSRGGGILNQNAERERCRSSVVSTNWYMVKYLHTYVYTQNAKIICGMLAMKINRRNM